MVVAAAIPATWTGGAVDSPARGLNAWGTSAGQLWMRLQSRTICGATSSSAQLNLSSGPNSFCAALTCILHSSRFFCHALVSNSLQQLAQQVKVANS